MRSLLALCCLALGFTGQGALTAEKAKANPNILIITVDDMNCDSLGAFGCKLPGTSPNVDRLAKEGQRFEYAHVVVGNCMPSRNVMWSGRYPHTNRVEGFHQVKDANYPVLADLMKERGYFTGIRGKVSHSTPYTPYGWDVVLDVIDGERPHAKDIHSYHRSAQEGIALSQKAGKPFCLMINVSDPHKPFYGMTNQDKVIEDPHKPSRIFTPEEVPIPGFLFDDPDVRRELAHYYSSVRRADDCVGGVLKALEESGQAENTFVMFLSDHGMPLPFAKTSLYHHSTHTPLIIRWPGVTKAGTIDKEHMVSAVDFLPTLLDAVGAKHPKGLEGRSFLPLFKGESQAGRDRIYKEYNENSGGARHPMRSVQTKKFGYIFNPWADGKRIFRTATQGTITYRKMKQIAPTNKSIADRVKMHDQRSLEEFYDYEKDPDALHNLIDDPAYQEEVNTLRKDMLAWMERTGDPLLDCFRHREDPEVLAAYMMKIEQEAPERRRPNKRQNAAPGNRRNAQVIQMQLPKTAPAGEIAVVNIAYTLPADLGEQLIHITLKDGNGKRIERQVKKAKGNGSLAAEFKIPADVPGGKVHFAAFIGEDFQNHLQYLTPPPIAVKWP